MFSKLSRILVLKGALRASFLRLERQRALQNSFRMLCQEQQSTKPEEQKSQKEWPSEPPEAFPDVNMTESEFKNINRFTNRSHCIGEVDDKLIGQRVTLYGWVQYERLGMFVVLRDSYGYVQAFVKNRAHREIVKKTKFSSVVRISGVVAKRPDKDINPEMKNGNIEVIIDDYEIVQMAMPSVPIMNLEDDYVTEKVRLEKRYLDLRSRKLYNNLRLRSRFIQDLRNCLMDQFNFLEIETPTLFKATPGGAQEFVVPTRFKDLFYSLVQSPQQFKQLLMMGGLDRYFQVARCYRDEGTKHDRQPEFTQLDIELSFTTMDKIMELIEVLLKQCWPIADEREELQVPFRKMTYSEAMDRFGVDKPDLRNENIEILNVGHDNFVLIIPESYDTKFLQGSFISEELPVISNTVPFSGKLNNFKYSAFDFKQELLNSETANRIHEMGLSNNDYIWLAAGEEKDCKNFLGRIRASIIDRIEKYSVENGEKRKLELVWIYDFPLFLRNENTGKLEPSHHPFTAPKDHHSEGIPSGLELMIGQNFDLVINGREIGGGSIRITDGDLQEYILKNILQCDSDSLEYFTEALRCGTPPHGGFAIGLDRLMALITGSDSIRDVMAFPKSAHGKDLMAHSPSPISDEVKKLYNIQV